VYSESNILYSVVRSSTVSDRIGYLIHVLIYNTYLVWKSNRKLSLAAIAKCTGVSWSHHSSVRRTWR
jgi:hypothetical protein